jgi:hypothetical protein
MANDTTSTNRPTHRIYSVTKDADGKSNWKDIGAAWPHRDGKGFNLRFTATPIQGAEVIVRVARPRKGGAQ